MSKAVTRSKRDQDVHLVNVLGAEKAWCLVYQGSVDYGPVSRQAECLKEGRRYAKELACDLVIHGKHGRIRRKISYGSDSPRRKG